MADYFFSDRPGFGNLSWLLMLGWVLSLTAGAYLYSMWQERNPVRARFVRRLGLGLSILSATGLVLLALKAFAVPVLDWRIWTYGAALVTLGFIGWATWFYRTRYPQLQATVGRPGGARPGGTARTYPSNGPRPTEVRHVPPRPVATTGRREARRDKKRKSR